MDKVCNLCGRVLNDEDKVFLHKTDDGTEYCLCGECEEKGVEVCEKKKFYICKVCGFPHNESEYNGTCTFCGNGEFKEIYLTGIEEEMLDKNPDKLYEQKLGKEDAKKIADWIESPKRKEAGLRHRRDRNIDTYFFFGIIISYLLLELNIRMFIPNWTKFFALLVPTVLILILPPVFKVWDRKQKDKQVSILVLPLITIGLMAIYWIIGMFF